VLKERKERLLQAAQAPLILAHLKKTIPQRADERIVAYRSQRLAAGTIEFVLTTQRIIELDFSGISWELDLKDIRSYEYKKTFSEMKCIPQSGKTRTVLIGDYYTYETIIAIIEDIRKGRLSTGSPPSIASEVDKPIPLQPLSYPLSFEMKNRGWMEGFKFTVTDTVGQTVFEGECRDSENMLIAEGDRLTVIKPQNGGTHFTFITPGGIKIGGVKKIEDLRQKPIHIFDEKDRKIGEVRKKVGLHSLTKHIYLFEIDDKLIMQLNFQNKGFWLTYQIEKVADVPALTERLCLYAIFTLRLLDPEMAEDPFRSNISSARDKLKGKIEGFG
jgi:hypothetical protein